MFDYFVYTYGPTLVLSILCAVFGALGHAAKQLWRSYVNTKEKESVAYTVAAFVEQVWKDIHGHDKLMKALETASELLKKKNIDFDAEEMRVLIEAAVAEFNDAFHQPLEDVNADAYRDNTEDVGASIAGTVEEIMTT